MRRSDEARAKRSQSRDVRATHAIFRRERDAAIHIAQAGRFGIRMNFDETEIEARDFSFYYGAFRALDSIAMSAPRHQITALIGPSGCGKSTLLRAMNRMHDRTPGAHAVGQLLLGGQDINGMNDLVELRKRVGMIFQRPNPFPMSIFDNVAYGMRLSTQQVPKRDIPERVEQIEREDRHTHRAVAGGNIKLEIV